MLFGLRVQNLDGEWLYCRNNCVGFITGRLTITEKRIRRGFGISRLFLSGIGTNFGDIKYMYGTSSRGVGRGAYGLLLELC